MLSNKTFSVIFFTRKSKNATQKLTLYVRITVNSQRAEISIKRSILPERWDPIRKRGKGTSQNIRILNNYLDYVYSQLLNCHKELLEEFKFISAHTIKARYLGEDEQHKTLKELITYHNTNMTSVLRKGTMKNYYTTEKYLIEFLNIKLRVEDIYLKQLNYRFIHDFEQFLRRSKPKKKRRPLTNNGIMKHLERFKKMINLSVKLEWLPHNPFQKFQLKFDKYEREYLSEIELKLIEETSFENKKLEKVKDIFLFACYTGLSYIDIKQLEVSQIIRGIDNNNWIYTKRVKTDEQVKIPLLPKAQEIINKYKNSPEVIITEYLLPVYSNQKMNDYIKEIVEICGIYKHVTFHVARHTFATTITLSNGVPIETVSKLLGHSKLSTTQIYARVLENKISEDMQNLILRFENKKHKENQIQFSESS